MGDQLRNCVGCDRRLSPVGILRVTGRAVMETFAGRAGGFRERRGGPGTKLEVSRLADRASPSGFGISLPGFKFSFLSSTS
jgi:hypothetical protein